MKRNVTFRLSTLVARRNRAHRSPRVKFYTAEKRSPTAEMPSLRGGIQFRRGGLHEERDCVEYQYIRESRSLVLRTHDATSETNRAHGDSGEKTATSIIEVC